MTLISATDTALMIQALGESLTIDDGSSRVTIYGIFTAAGSTELVDGQPVVVEFPRLTVATAAVSAFIRGGEDGTVLTCRGQDYLVTEYYHDGEGITQLALTEIEG